MGRRKSHVKREKVVLRLKANLSAAPPENIIFLGNHEKKVYRFFSEEWQADAFAKGDIFLSTLERCRAYEDAEQGDKEEGHQTYLSGHIIGGSDDAQFVEQARRLGVNVGEGTVDMGFSNVSHITAIPDAYVLCTTTEFSPEKLNDTFGKYCVAITEPRRFFYLLSESINARSTIFKAIADEIEYADRSYTGMDSPNGIIGFVKPVDPYAKQKEFRFLWHMDQQGKLEPFLLKCPKARFMCKRIA